MSETIDADIIKPNAETALVIHQPQPAAPTGLFGTQEPVAIIEKATSIATALKAVITKQGLISRISGKEYPKCEAWTLLGTMLGVFPVLCWSRPVEGGWEARVEARTRDGATVGAAEAECLKSEKNWSNRDDFALRSMAQTRATAKCLRMPLGFVMTLAGYEATPAEEMVSDHPHRSDNAPRTTPAFSRAAPEPPTAPTKPPIPPAPAGAPRTAQDTKKPLPPVPTDVSRSKMIAALKAGPGEPNRDTVTEYFRKVPNAAGSDSPQLAPFEQLEDLNLRYVPSTTGQMNALAAKIAEFGNGLQVSMAFPPHVMPGEQPEPTAPKPLAAAVNRAIAAAETKTKDPLWWRTVIISVPRKGSKRDAYLKKPDTIGALYDKRHGTDDESNIARQRLWGFQNWKPEPRKGISGKTFDPTEADWNTYHALQAFYKWFAENHPGEKL